MRMKQIQKIITTLVFIPALAFAQSFPTKPIRLVVPFGPGGVADITARTVMPKMSESLGQPIVIENKPSAGGVGAGQEVAKGARAGEPLLLTKNGPAGGGPLFKSFRYTRRRTSP